MRQVLFISTVLLLLSGACQSSRKAGTLTAGGIAPISSSTATSGSEAPTGLNLGNQAPEISLKNPAGATVPLSSLRGKVVLIDFWASWCGPCRFENPAVVRAYKTYHQNALTNKREFTVYSVSLDMDINAWKKAIEKDSLMWAYHVSDLKGWGNEAAAKYGVTGIPTNFLVNEKGIIINKNLRGQDLMNALEKLAH